jgi:hypothetical protein
MLNRPARNASPTPRPPRISGVALTRVSEMGPRMPASVPLAAVFGLKIAPSKRARYPSTTARPAAVKVSHG